MAEELKDLGGLVNKDMAFSKLQPNVVYDSKNFRVTTDDGATLAVRTNIKGNSFAMSIPDIPCIDTITIDRTLLNTYLITHNLSLTNVELDVELEGTNFTGHPDAVIGDSIVVEVKTTSKLDSDHPYFIQQLSAYMALNKNFKYGLLVL